MKNLLTEDRKYLSSNQEVRDTIPKLVLKNYKQTLDEANWTPGGTLAAPPQSDPITELLRHSKTIAVVGLSSNPLRPSHGVSAYMQAHGYHIIPVNPNIEECLAEKAYRSLLDVPENIDIVNIFRRPEFVEEVVDQAIQRKIPVVWMQEEVIHERAAEKARRAGIFVVMDRCILKEHRDRFR